MNGHDIPRSVRQAILTERVGAELLVYDESRHMAFCLNAASRAVWCTCDGARTMAQIAAAASADLGTPVSEEFARFAVAELRRDGLIEPAAETAARNIPALSRRQMLQRLGAGGALLLPAVAAIMAPKAAEAYSGCVKCSSEPAVRAARQQALSGANQ